MFYQTRIWLHPRTEPERLSGITTGAEEAFGIKCRGVRRSAKIESEVNSRRYKTNSVLERKERRKAINGASRKLQNT